MVFSGGKPGCIYWHSAVNYNHNNNHSTDDEFLTWVAQFPSTIFSAWLCVFILFYFIITSCPWSWRPGSSHCWRWSFGFLRSTSPPSHLKVHDCPARSLARRWWFLSWKASQTVGSLVGGKACRQNTSAHVNAHTARQRMFSLIIMRHLVCYIEGRIYEYEYYEGYNQGYDNKSSSHPISKDFKLGALRNFCINCMFSQ